LKRKNGLFKKAYELGVLCSVDVAVIIFEERPGHQVKLYQYCSGDVAGIVQRQLQFDGDRDTKTPVDFSNTKGEEGGDDEDEIEEEDTNVATSRQNSKKEKPKDSTNIKLKDSPSTSNTGNAGTISIRPQSSTSRSSMEVDDRAHPSRTPSLPIATPVNTIPVLPISNDRHPSGPSSQTHSTPALGGGISMPLPISMNMSSHKRSRPDDPVVPPPELPFPYRLNVDLSTYPPATHATSLAPHGSSHSHPPHPHIPPHALNLPFPHNAMGLMGMQNPNFPSQYASALEQLAGRIPGYPSMAQPGHAGYAASLEGLFGTRAGAGPQSQTTNMLLDLLSSTAGVNVSNSAPPPFPSFDWPVTSSQPHHAESHNHNNNEAAAWLEFLATSSPPSQGNMNLNGLPTPKSANRTPSSSVSSVSSYDRMRGASPSRKRHRDDASDSDGPKPRVRKRDSDDGLRNVAKS